MELSQFASEEGVEHLGTETVKDISFAKFQKNSEIFYLFQSNPNTIHTPVLDEVGIKKERVYGIPMNSSLKRVVTQNGVEQPIRNL